MNEEYKEEIKDIKKLLVEDNLTYSGQLRFLAYTVKLEEEIKQLKDRINKANNLTKRIKNDIWVKMAECYENEDNWNGDFLNTEINSIDRLLALLKGDKE